VSAREEILTRLRIALRDVPAEETTEAVPVERGYRHAGRLGAAARADLLADRLSDYRATVYRCSIRQLPTIVKGILAAHDTETLVVPHDLKATWYRGFDGTVRADDPADPLSVADLDAADTVLTGCAVAIATTGTLVLDAGPAQGRRALTLVPDHHICVVRAAAIVEIVPEALARLDPARPLTFISGPSATSDIEFNRVEGVHGPRNLDVVVVS
jgi:L-lactate dehydrogenase complex protein LldG